MSRIFVFAAMDMEGQYVRDISGPNELVLNVVGMGPRNATAKAEAALREGDKPHAIVVIGLCGGLTASLSEGTIVAYKECLSTEANSPRMLCCRTTSETMLEMLASAQIPCESAVGITSRRIATTRAERLSLAKSGATVVDMESYCIARVATQFGVPVVVLRVVSDSIDRKLPDLNRALDDGGALDNRKALRVALASPLKTARLLAANRRAMQRLRPALEVALKANL
jgi:nucleoside phosphorylase